MNQIGYDLPDMILKYMKYIYNVCIYIIVYIYVYIYIYIRHILDYNGIFSHYQPLIINS